VKRSAGDQKVVARFARHAIAMSVVVLTCVFASFAQDAANAGTVPVRMTVTATVVGKAQHARVDPAGHHGQAR
jgi:hypothetical protein